MDEDWNPLHSLKTCLILAASVVCKGHSPGLAQCRKHLRTRRYIGNIWGVKWSEDGGMIAKGGMTTRKIGLKAKGKGDRTMWKVL